MVTRFEYWHRQPLILPSIRLRTVKVGILGQLLQSKARIYLVVTIADWYSKLTHMISKGRLILIHTDWISLNYWVVSYEITDTVLSDNGEQYCSKNVISLCNYFTFKNGQLCFSCRIADKQILAAKCLYCVLIVHGQQSIKPGHNSVTVMFCLQCSERFFHQYVPILFDGYGTLARSRHNIRSSWATYGRVTSEYARCATSLCYGSTHRYLTLSGWNITSKSKSLQILYWSKNRTISKLWIR